MNHKKAMPTNGTMFNATATVLALVASQAPGSCGSAGTELRRSQNTAISRTENSIPAIAAALGVLRLCLVSESTGA